MEAPIQEQKAELRGRIRHGLRSMDSANRAEEGVAIRRAIRAWPAWMGARSVLGFLPLATEVDLRPLLAEAIQRGMRVSVPEITPDGTFRPCLLRSLDPSTLESDPMGIQVPRHREPVDATELDMVLVPGMAFDAAGHRLGRGGGFYDRFLPGLRREAFTVGVCFGLQRVPTVPTEAHDARVEWLALTSGVVAAQPVSPI
jgi:5-formyltetrahydrofolate cyclo-ligase